MKKHQRLMRFCRPMMMAGTIAVATLTASADVAIDDAHFPDTRFRQSLSGFDKNKDGKFSDAEIAEIKKIDCSNRGVSTLKGVEWFTALTELSCSKNQLKSLDLSANTALTTLDCSQNQISSLDLSKNGKLETLKCYRNSLTSLDLSANKELKTLYCENNQLRSLDMSANTALEYFDCDENQLTSLDVSANTALTHLYCEENQLTSVDVSGCTGLVLLSCKGNKIETLKLNVAKRMKNLDCSNNSLKRLDLSENTKLTKLDCSNNSLKRLDLSENTKLTTLDCSNNALTSLDLSANTALTTLTCTGNERTVNAPYREAGTNECYLPIEELNRQLNADGFRIENTSGWSNATEEVIGGKTMFVIADATQAVTYTYRTGKGDVTFTIKIDTTQAKDYKVVINDTNFPDANFRAYVKTLAGAEDGMFTESELAGITEINCSSKNIQDLKGIEWFTELTHLRCWVNKLESLDLSRNTKLVHLACSENALKGLALSSNTALSYLDCSKNNIESLDLSGNLSLKTMHCFNNALKSLGLSANTALTYLDCSNNQLTSLDLSGNTALSTLKCEGNERTVNAPYREAGTNECYLPIEELNRQLNADGFRIENTSGWSNATEEEIGGKTMFVIADATQAVTYTYRTGKGDVTFTLNIDRANQSIIKVAINDTNFPDANFRAYVKTLKGAEDGKFIPSEIAEIREINCTSKNISNLKGIEMFTALTGLYCSYNSLESLDLRANTALTDMNCNNNPLESLDLSANTKLKVLFCNKVQLRSLDLRANTALTGLYCSYNSLASLDVSGCTALTQLRFDETKLASLNVSGCTALGELLCPSNSLESLDVSGCTALTYLNCYSNQLESLDVSGCTALGELLCSDNQLKSLDVSANTKLQILNCEDNQLTSLDLSANTALTYLNCSDNQLTSLDLSKNGKLETLKCYRNSLTSLDLSRNTALTRLTCTGNKRDVAVNFKYEKDGKTYYYIDMEADERDGMSGDEFHNKLGEGFCVENVISWTGASVGETPVGAKALILEGQPTSITYIYNTLKAPRSRAVDGNMTVTLNLNYDDVTTAVDNIDADTAVSIYMTAGEIHIEGSEAEARVYDMTGHCIYAGMDRKISVVSGIYIVKVGGITKKIAIK